MKNSSVTSLLLQRLEHIPADSIWAHQASGVRGSLLKMLQRLENGENVEDREVRGLLSRGFQILERAAREKTAGSAMGHKEKS
jgi:hypothetical protein